MNKIKLIALDMDGTLLDSKGNVSASNEKMIKEALNKGIYVIFCTGRMYRSANEYRRFLPEKMPIIGYNGAMIRESGYGKTIYHQGLPRELNREVFTALEQHSLNINVYANDSLYGVEGNPTIKDYAAFTQVPYTLLSQDKLIEMLQAEELTKMVGIGAKEKVAEFLRAKESEMMEKIYLSRSFDYFLEVGHLKVNKGSGLKILGDKLGIKMSEIMGIGDNLNDQEMLAEVGFPVIMGNGHEELLNKGYFTTKSNEQSGVAHAIKEHI